MSFLQPNLQLAAWLMNSVEIFSAAQIDKLNGLIKTLAVWLTNVFDIFEKHWKQKPIKIKRILNTEIQVNKGAHFHI